MFQDLPAEPIDKEPGFNEFFNFFGVLATQALFWSAILVLNAPLVRRTYWKNSL